MLSAEDYPDVPAEQRPRNLYVDQNVDSQVYVELHNKGWRVVDLRLEPASSDAERAEIVKNWLAGVREGSIAADPSRLKFVELEAQIFGLRNAKSAATTKRASEEDKDISSLLTFNSSRAFRGTFGNQAISGVSAGPPKRGRGRPRKNSSV